MSEEERWEAVKVMWTFNESRDSNTHMDAAAVDAEAEQHNLNAD